VAVEAETDRVGAGRNWAVEAEQPDGGEGGAGAGGGGRITGDERERTATTSLARRDRERSLGRELMSPTEAQAQSKFSLVLGLDTSCTRNDKCGQD
jgi:hypothetical protein